MSFFSRLKGLFGVTFGGPGAGAWWPAKLWSRGGDLVLPGVLTDPYRQHAVTRTGVSLLARAAASIDLEVFGPGDTETPIADHPALALWKRPNPYLSGRQLFELLYLHRVLFGEHIWYYPALRLPAAGSSGALGRLQRQGDIEILDPRQVVNEVKGGVMVWTERVDGKVKRTLDPERMTIFRDLDPTNLARGISKMEAIFPEAEADFAAQSWSTKWFKNGAVPTLVIKPSKERLWNKDQRDDMLRAWREEHGSRQRGIGILMPGDDIQDLSTTHHEMEFERLRAKADENILGVIGVPPFMSGRMENANYANSREQRQVFLLGSVKPLVDDTVATLNHDFFAKIGVRDEVFAKWEAVMAIMDDQGLKSEIAKRYFEMGIPVEQINERLELGFDPADIPGSDVGYLPLNLVPADSLEAMDVSGPPVSGTVDATGPMPVGAAALRALHTADLTPADVRESRRTQIWKNLIVRTFDLELRFDKTVRSHFQGLRQEADRNTATRGWQMRAKVVKDDGEFFFFDMDTADRQISRATKATYEATVRRAGDSLLADLGIEGSFNLLDPRVIMLVQSRAFRIRGINDTLERQLRAQLSASLAAGETVDQLRDRVDGIFKAGLGRSRIIARTEVGSAFNEGRHVAMKTNGVSKQEWLTSRDSSVRDSHAEIDGEAVMVGESFSNGLLFPLDPAGPVEEVANCRCVALAVVEAA